MNVVHARIHLTTPGTLSDGCKATDAELEERCPIDDASLDRHGLNHPGILKPGHRLFSRNRIASVDSPHCSGHGRHLRREKLFEVKICPELAGSASLNSCALKSAHSQKGNGVPVEKVEGGAPCKDTHYQLIRGSSSLRSCSPHAGLRVFTPRWTKVFT
jgi:hypothetical protein